MPMWMIYPFSFVGLLVTAWYTIYKLVEMYDRKNSDSVTARHSYDFDGK